VSQLPNKAPEPSWRLFRFLDPLASQEDVQHKDRISVGRVLSPWGVNGEVKVYSLTDFPERFSASSRLLIEGATVVVESMRQQKNVLVVKFSGVDNRNRAESIKGKLLEIYETDVFPLAEGEYYQFELMGLTVLSSGGDLLGTITEIISTGSNDVFVVQKDDSEILIPDLRHVVEQVDLENKTMIVELIPGLI